MDKCDYCTGSEIMSRGCTKCFTKFRVCSSHINKTICQKCTQPKATEKKVCCDVCNVAISIIFESNCPKCKKSIYLCNEHITSTCKNCLPRKVSDEVPVKIDFKKEAKIEAQKNDIVPCEQCGLKEDDCVTVSFNRCFTKTHQMVVCPICFQKAFSAQECPICKKLHIVEPLRCYIGTFLYDKVLLWNPVSDFWTLNDLEFLEDTDEEMLIPDNNATVPLHRLKYQAICTGGYDPIKTVPIPDCYLIASTPYDSLTVEKTVPLSCARFLHCAESDYNLTNRQNIVYIMGGLTYNKSIKQWLNECEKLIITNKEVTKAPMAPMIEPRSQFSTALLKQRIYAFGGFAGEGKKSSKFAEFYDINSNIWYELNIPQSSILCESFCLQVSVVGNEEIVLLGGTDGNQLLGNVVKFNPTTMKIECLPSMNVKRAGFAVLEDNGALYACYGGGSSGICCEKFEGGKWVMGREWVNDLAGYEEDDINVSDLISSHFKMFI